MLRRGSTIRRVTSISEFEDVDKLKETLIRQEGLNDQVTVNRFINHLK